MTNCCNDTTYSAQCIYSNPGVRYVCPSPCLYSQPGLYYTTMQVLPEPEPAEE